MSTITTADELSAIQIQQLNNTITMQPSSDGTKFGTLFDNVVADVAATNESVALLENDYPTATAINYMGNRTVTQINALSPSRGWVVIATDSGTPSAGSSDALTAGDGAEYNGTSWKKLWDGVNAFPPVDTTLIVAATGATLYSPLTSVTDNAKVVVFDGLSLSPISKTSPTAADYRLISNSVSVNNGQLYQYQTQWASLSYTTQAAAISRVSSTASETFFTPVKVISATTAAVGDVYRFDIGVNIAGITGTPTIVLKVYIGATAIITTDSLSVSANDFVSFSGFFQVNAIGASGAVSGMCLTAADLAGATPPFETFPELISASPDLSADNNFRVSATWSASSASNQADLRSIGLIRCPYGAT